jgi:hypothetical protein
VSEAEEAFLKALVSTGFKIPTKTIALSIQAGLLEEVVHHVWTLHKLGFELLATPETYPFLEAKGIPCKLVKNADSTETPNIKTLISNANIDLVVNLRDVTGVSEARTNYLTRRTAVDFGVPLLTNAQLFIMFTQSLQKLKQGKFQFGEVCSPPLSMAFPASPTHSHHHHHHHHTPFLSSTHTGRFLVRPLRTRERNRGLDQG